MTETKRRLVWWTAVTCWRSAAADHLGSHGERRAQTSALLAAAVPLIPHHVHVAAVSKHSLGSEKGQRFMGLERVDETGIKQTQKKNTKTTEISEKKLEAIHLQI